jgi:hypothetical protein
MERIQVIAKSIVTWAAVTQAVLLIAIDQVGPLLPDGYQAWIQGAAAVAVVLGAAVAALRQVTPVLPAERGILPPK